MVLGCDYDIVSKQIFPIGFPKANASVPLNEKLKEQKKAHARAHKADEVKKRIKAASSWEQS